MRAGRVVAALASVIVITGCGSASSASTRRTSSSASSTSTAKPSQPFLGKSPKQIVAEASNALRRAHGFTIQGSIAQGSHRVDVKVAEASPASIRLSIVNGNTSEQLIQAGGGAYFRANRAFWAEHSSPQAAQLADRWVELPAASSRAFTASLGALAPQTLARCLTEGHGTLSIVGTTTVDHRRAILIRDAGNAPGSSPGTLAIASAGPPYPLAVTDTGGQRAGGRIDVCNQGKATNQTGMLTLGQFGHVPPITPPTNPLRLDQPPTV